MLLAFDIGNTNTVIGCFKGQELQFQFRLSTDLRRTKDEYQILLQSILDSRSGADISISAAIISSVVPPVTPAFADYVESAFGIVPFIVGPGMKTGISIKTSEPAAVGADRIVNAVAVKNLFGLPALAVDFGTATSFDYVDADSNYWGGIIAPGLEISLDALVSRTAKLPRIELTCPKRVIGRNTVTAMQSGAVLGYCCLVDGLIDRIIEEVGPIEHIVATGGAGGLITAESSRITAFDSDLNLKGLAFLAETNK